MITSKNNPTIKALKKLHTRKGRQKVHQYLIEGPHLVKEAIQSQAPIKAIYALEEKREEDYKSYPLETISSEVADALSQTEQTQGVYALIGLREEVNLEPTSPHILLVDAIQDPGNLGTLIRTADAFSYRDIYLGQGTIDPYNDKVVRSMQGSQFHVNLHQVDLEKWIPRLQSKGYLIMATELNPSAQALERLSFNPHQKFGIVLGNEGNGVCSSVIEKSDLSLYITMPGCAESLNVAIAGAIAMHHFVSVPSV